MSIHETIIWGIFTGIITSTFLFIAGLFFTKVILPWYQGIIFDGVDLEGVWTSDKDFEEGILYTYQMTVKQNAHSLTGIATISRNGSGAQNYVQNFNLIGSTWEGYLTVNLKSTDRTRLSFVSGLFKVENRGQRLKGYWAYRSRDDLVEIENLLFNRET